MAIVYKDRVSQDCTAPSGSAAFDFSAAADTTGYQPWVDALANGDTAIYSASDSSGNWEVGLGTWTESGETLARTTVLSSSNAGSHETFSGTVTVELSLDAVRVNALERIRVSGFSAYGDGSTQTNCGTSTSTTAITSGWSELFDVNSEFSSGIFQPTTSGLYMIGGTLVGGQHDDAKYCAIYCEHSTDGSSWSSINDHGGLLWRGAASASNQAIGGSGAIITTADGVNDRWRLSYFHNGNGTSINVPATAANRTWQRFWARYIGETA